MTVLVPCFAVRSLRRLVSLQKKSAHCSDGDGIVATVSDRLVVADRGDAGRRLDLVLRRHLADVGAATRSRVQSWIANGHVSLNGTLVHDSARRAKPGDVVRVVLPDCWTPKAALPENLALDVLYEDDHLLAINKAAGMVVHPAYRHRTGTLINGLLWRARTWPVDQRPSLVGRLDRLTSGVLIVAKTAAIHRAMQRATTSIKDYLAVVYGRPKPRGTLDVRIAGDPDDRRRIVVSPAGGVASVTRFERLAWVAAPGAGLSLLRCRLVTGRRHQIRVHLAANGWPLIGDPVYGEPRWTEVVDSSLADRLRAFPRQALHSWQTTFVHPISETPMTIELPIDSSACGICPPALKRITSRAPNALA